MGGILLSVDKETSNECVSAKAERERGHGVADSVPADAHVLTRTPIFGWFLENSGGLGQAQERSGEDPQSGHYQGQQGERQAHSA